MDLLEPKREPIFGVIDLETAPDVSLPLELWPQFDPSTVKHGNTKDVLKRKAKEEQARQEFEAGKIKAMSLDPDMAMIVYLSAWDFFEASEPLCRLSFPVPVLNHVEAMLEEEYALVHAAWTWMDHHYERRIPIVTKNGLHFDIPVLIKRAMMLDIPVNPETVASLTNKYKTHHIDLQFILSHQNQHKWKSLDWYAKRYGLGSTTGNGSEVYDQWMSGNYDLIKRHCEADAYLTGKIYERLRHWIH
jgi:hypothetical protein